MLVCLLQGVDVDCGEIPDAAMTLAVVALSSAVTLEPGALRKAITQPGFALIAKYGHAFLVAGSGCGLRGDTGRSNDAVSGGALLLLAQFAQH